MNMGGPEAPCKDCEERETACHTKCQKYREYSIKRREYREMNYNKSKVDYLLTGFSIDRGKRIRSNSNSYLKVLNRNKKAMEGNDEQRVQNGLE